MDWLILLILYRQPKRKLISNLGKLLNYNTDNFIKRKIGRSLVKELRQYRKIIYYL
jgi:hypothetical protein